MCIYYNAGIMHRMTRRKGFADTVIIVTSVLFRARAGENVRKKNCYSNYIVARNNNIIMTLLQFAPRRVRELAPAIYTRGKKKCTHIIE